MQLDERDALLDIYESRAQADHPPPGDGRDSPADVSRASTDPGYEPSVSVEWGFRQMRIWSRAQDD
jgi:nucleoside-diphosphate-sugar epimerase